MMWIIGFSHALFEPTYSFVFDILHIVGNSLSTLLRATKILAMDHDPSLRRRGIRILEIGPRCPRCGGGKDKLH